MSDPAYTGNLFYLVDRLRDYEKYFDTSRQEMVRTLQHTGSYEIYCLHEVEDDGAPVAAKLRLNIKCKGLKTSWSVALKLRSVRIDGIDHESKFQAADGNRARGWHRHAWDSSAGNAEKLKLPLHAFHRKLSCIEDFLICAFQEMRIFLDRVNHGNNGLRLF